ncbi:MAG: hypothetical protein MJ176_05925 [Treponema sp.]|nr:hypothetical protein [Treponema sp.]
MTKEKSNDLIKAIERNLGGNDLVCPLCKSTEWTVTSKIYKLPIFHEDDISAIMNRDDCFPVIPLICEKCGNTYFINAVAANILSKDGDDNND